MTLCQVFQVLLPRHIKLKYLNSLTISSKYLNSLTIRANRGIALVDKKLLKYVYYMFTPLLSDFQVQEFSMNNFQGYIHGYIEWIVITINQMPLIPWRSSMPIIKSIESVMRIKLYKTLQFDLHLSLWTLISLHFHNQFS